MYFALYLDAAGEWRWRLKAANHEIIAVSSEGYTRKVSAQDGIKLVKSAYNAPVYETQNA